MTGNTTTFEDVINGWERDGATGGHGIHPLPVDSAEWWALGEAQAAQVDDYATDGDLVIDFGCGLGRLAIPLVNRGYTVLAVDASQSMLDGLAERAAAAGVDVGHVRSDGSDLPDIVDDIINEQAAVVISRAVLIHHDYASVQHLVTQLTAVLRPGGHLIADWPIAEHPRERTNWTDVTTWHPHHRLAVARLAGLEPVEGTDVWRKTP
jgi:2-polyprenyl-3-methyl-5-hydroxy-6-metoxy-1,4-benzoquinol methylase